MRATALAVTAFGLWLLNPEIQHTGLIELDSPTQFNGTLDIASNAKTMLLQFPPQ